jgi:hypothetical protein
VIDLDLTCQVPVCLKCEIKGVCSFQLSYEEEKGLIIFLLLDEQLFSNGHTLTCDCLHLANMIVLFYSFGYLDLTTSLLTTMIHNIHTMRISYLPLPWGLRLRR